MVGTIPVHFHAEGFILSFFMYADFPSINEKIFFGFSVKLNCPFIVFGFKHYFPDYLSYILMKRKLEILR